MVHADISRDDTASALGIVATARAPVLALCRKLVEAGHDPALPLEAYRGAVLCLRVRSIGAGARLDVKEDRGDGCPGFVPYRSLADKGLSGVAHSAAHASIERSLPNPPPASALTPGLL